MNNSTLQWSISWNSALFPLQEMLPPESFFRAEACDNTTFADSKHLFGFESYVPCLTLEQKGNVSHTEDTLDVQNEKPCCATVEDFLALLMVEECTSSL